MPDEKRIERRASPPAMVRVELGDGEMQVRRVLRGVAGCADIPDDIAAPHVSPFLHIRTPIEVRVLVHKLL